jgi:threonylcarbamoyladenosine tRNA methylthiotransferase MtaB
MPTYRIENLGCKANLYDAQRLAESLEELGYRRAPEGARADVCVLNSCTVTSGADRKSRQQAARLARENPGTRVFVTGCYATASPEELREVDGVDGVFARDDWDELLAALDAGAPADQAAATGGADFGISSFNGRTRAFMKIEDGCDACCSYCILPQVRGKPRSRPLGAIAAEARRLVRAGFPEIVLTGIHLGFYGRGLPGAPSLADAVRTVARTEGVRRVRISSLEAVEVDGALLDTMQHPAVLPHLHLPLQSGDADVLAAMNRRYSPRQFLATVELAREKLDRPAITTDVMVGFPGETGEQFENTLEVCRRARFSRMHVFSFSPRPGTPAASMEGQVPPEVASERSARLRELGRRMAGEWAESFVGQTVRVLCERRAESGLLRGYTDRYVPIYFAGEADRVGQSVDVRCTGRKGASLAGELAMAGAGGYSGRY